MVDRPLHRGVADALGHRIAGHELPAGSVVNLADLEREHGVSRTVAREAMRLLESLGMVEARRRVGLIVTEETRWNVMSPQVISWRLAGPKRDEQLRSLLELRIAIEPTAARSAAMYALPEERQRLLDLAERLNEMGHQGLGQTREYLMVDVEFHETLLHASSNEMLEALDQVVRTVLVGRTELGLSPAYPVPEVLQHHISTARAIQAGMPEAAEVYARLLVSRVRAEFVLPDPPRQVARRSPDVFPDR